MSKGKSNRERRRKGPKPPRPDSLEAEVPRKLSEPEIDERARRLARKTVERKTIEDRKRKAMRSFGEDIKVLREECERLAEEIVHGEEMVKQGDLFAPPKADGKVPPVKVAQALSKVQAAHGQAASA